MNHLPEFSTYIGGWNNRHFVEKLMHFETVHFLSPMFIVFPKKKYLKMCFYKNMEKKSLKKSESSFSKMKIKVNGFVLCVSKCNAFSYFVLSVKLNEELVFSMHIIFFTFLRKNLDTNCLSEHMVVIFCLTHFSLISIVNEFILNRLTPLKLIIKSIKLCLVTQFNLSGDGERNAEFILKSSYECTGKYRVHGTGGLTH